VGADDLIDRNRRLLVLADATRVLTRLLVKEVAENRLLLHATLLRTVHLHYGRTGLLADAIYLRFSIALEKITHPATRCTPTPPGQSSSSSRWDTPRQRAPATARPMAITQPINR
jgi:hypothetical protein